MIIVLILSCLVITNALAQVSSQYQLTTVLGDAVLRFDQIHLSIYFLGM